MPDSPAELLEKFVDESAEALTNAMMIDFPAESPGQMAYARVLFKRAIMDRLAQVVMYFMVEDAVPILLKLKGYGKEEDDAG